MPKNHPVPRLSALAAASLLAMWPLLPLLSLSSAHAAELLAAASNATEVVVTAQRLATPALLPATTESVSAAQIAETNNTVTTAGVLQYLPSVHVRERYIGDRNAVLVMPLDRP